MTLTTTTTTTASMSRKKSSAGRTRKIEVSRRLIASLSKSIWVLFGVWIERSNTWYLYCDLLRWSFACPSKYIGRCFLSLWTLLGSARGWCFFSFVFLRSVKISILILSETKSVKGTSNAPRNVGTLRDRRRRSGAVKMYLEYLGFLVFFFLVAFYWFSTSKYRMGSEGLITVTNW